MHVYSPATISVLPVMHFCENRLALLVLQLQRVLEGQGSGLGSVQHNVDKYSKRYCMCVS